MSTPGSNPGGLFAHPDTTVAGSGQGELAYGPAIVNGMAEAVASWGLTWTPDEVRVWVEGDVAWAQILGSVHVVREGVDELVPYWTTGVFARGAAAWEWRYWGGAEPQAEPKV